MVETSTKVKLGILGSTRGTSAQHLFDLNVSNTFPAQIQVVISNIEDAYILERARNHGIETVFLSPKGLKRTTFDRKVSETLRKYGVDLILCIGYMRILSEDFINEWTGKALNVHPSLLPEFGGGMDLNVHQAVIDAKRVISGCTVHLMTKEVDSGPIVIQKKCNVLETDSAEDLKKKVQALEGPALAESVIKYSNALDKSTWWESDKKEPEEVSNVEN